MALTGEPSSRDELVEVLRASEQRDLLDAEVLSIIEGALTVSDMRAREIMVPGRKLSSCGLTRHRVRSCRL